MRTLSIVLLLILSFTMGCDNEDNGDPDRGTRDTGTPDIGTRDMQADSLRADGKPPADTRADGPRTDTLSDALTADLGPSPIVNTFGLNMRIPQERTVPCNAIQPYDPTELTEQDMDWICTFDHGGQQGYVYLQNNLLDCQIVMSAQGVFTGAGGYISVGGVVTPLQNTGYDWGGNHHNDWLFFDHAGKSYRYYHSSFGFGWRTCQPMDCLQVYPPGGTNPSEDGCTSDRTLPAVCLRVEAGKSYAPTDFADTFQKCPGDES